MKEATGEATNTVVTIILIAGILAAAVFLIAIVTGKINNKANSTGNNNVDLINGTIN